MRFKVPTPVSWPPPGPKELPFELALKTGVAAGLSLYAADALGLGFPVYALLAVATTAELGASSSFLLVCYRLIGTVLGVTATVVVVPYLTVSPLSAGIVMGGLP